MHWSEEIAQKIINRNPNKQEYVCAAGISPSGSIHIGNFRDVATSYFVVKALRKMGKKARLLFSWDEFDRMRKVPVNVANIDDKMEQYIGYPYVDIKNPFDNTDGTYAEYFEKEFENSIKEFGIEMDYRHQAEMYRSGKYSKHIIHSLKKRKEIFDIIDSHRTQNAAEGERDSYYPVSIYCPSCFKDTTKITTLSEDCINATFVCNCGHNGTFDFTKDFNCKLAWKIDWPMRWMYEEVDFEPGGKDHATINGSYDTSKDISKAIFDYQAPIFQGYEFIGIRGTTGKMSGSSGLNLTPAALLSIYQPEVIFWLYSKTDPMKAFDFCFDEGILRQYFEFDKMYTDCQSGSADEYIQSIMYNTNVEQRTISPVPMGQLVQLGSVVNFDAEMLEIVFEKIGTPYSYNQYIDRLDRAKYWLEHCAPEQVNKLRITRNFDVFDNFSEKEKQEISLLQEYIFNGGYSLEDLKLKLYAIIKQIEGENISKKELQDAQAKFFKNVYKLIIDKETGPRLYLFLYAINPENYIKLLDFSHPKTEQEIEIEQANLVVETVEIVKEYGEPDPISQLKDEISFDTFNLLDLRVCKIIKASEIRKSANCLKLTLDDGIDERVIVSSIKHDYTTDELIGKKIIVVANLSPVRIAGVTSQGMLLAAANNACGCQVVFVNDIVPVGTLIK